MNGNDSSKQKPETIRSYSCEYVELKMELRDLAGLFKAELAKVFSKVESTEHYVRDIQRDAARLDNLVQSNRAAIASLKAAASFLGASAGLAVSFLARWIGRGTAS